MTYAGMKVKDARKRTGLTQRQLAEHSGVSLSTIRKLEQGERSGARMETMHALARALRLPTMSLVTEPDEEGARAETRELWEPVRAELMRPLSPDRRSRHAERSLRSPCNHGPVVPKPPFLRTGVDAAHSPARRRHLAGRGPKRSSQGIAACGERVDAHPPVRPCRDRGPARPGRGTGPHVGGRERQHSSVAAAPAGASG